MIEFRSTAAFDRWLRNLGDRIGKARILARLESAGRGHLGDCVPVGEGVMEMRIHVGPGYRVYFVRQGTTVYLLLSGGAKASQKRDIRRAVEIARALRRH